MSLSWTAHRRGNKRCAPACGRGCTQKEFEAAWTMGRTALKMLKNKKGWKIRVWENLGWHVQLKKGGLNLHINKYGDELSFSTLFSADGDGGGEMYWTTDYRSADPNKVVACQLKVAKAFAKKIQNAIAEAA